MSNPESKVMAKRLPASWWNRHYRLRSASAAPNSKAEVRRVDFCDDQDVRLLDPTQDEVRQLFDYHDDGTLTYKDSILLGKRRGKLAGVESIRSRLTTISLPYIGEGRKRYMTRGRINWIYHKGAIPDDVFVRHESSDWTDDRIENLCLTQEIPGITRPLVHVEAANAEHANGIILALTGGCLILGHAHPEKQRGYFEACTANKIKPRVRMRP